MDKFDIVVFCAIFAFVILITYGLLNQKPAKANPPAATEIPEYVMKCTEHGPNVCTEYTIYRVTRN